MIEMQQKGLLMTCDRCGTTLMRACTGIGESDGGYTRWDKFEEAKDWIRVTVKNITGRYADFCPECAEWYNELKDEFERNVNREIITGGDTNARTDT